MAADKIAKTPKKKNPKFHILSNVLSETKESTRGKNLKYRSTINPHK